MEEEVEESIEKSHCNRCGGQRNHEVLAANLEKWSDEADGGFPIQGADLHQFMKCCGCGALHLRQQSWYMDGPGEDSTYGPTVRYFPPKVERHEPRWTRSATWACMFNDPVRQLHEEIYKALGAECMRLAAMGIRALIETVMVSKTGDHGGFNTNLKALRDAGLISTLQLNQLETVLEVGHATIHRLFSPSESEVHSALDITENLIEALYISPVGAAKVAAKVPPRPPKSKP